MKAFKRILCPVDFSEPSRTALEHAEQLARTLQAEVVLTHVLTPSIHPVAFGALPVAAGSQVEASLLHAAEAALRSRADELAAQGITCTSRVEIGLAAQRIVDCVRELGIDLVVMGTHGHTGLGHALLGSVAERVVRHCPCPVLTVKAGQVRG